MNLTKIRQINLALTAVGAAIFVSLFLYISLAPKDFDERTRRFAISQVQIKIDEQLSALAQSSFADRASALAGRISDRLQTRIETMREELESGMDVFIADILASSCKLDCKRRDEAAKAVRQFYELPSSAIPLRLTELKRWFKENMMTS